MPVPPLFGPPILETCLYLPCRTPSTGLFGFGGASPFLTAFQPVYVAKQIGTGFLFQHHGMTPSWSLWGLAANQPEAACSCVGAIGKKPAPGEAEAAIKASCRS